MSVNKSYKISIFFFASLIIALLALSLSQKAYFRPDIFLITIDALRADHLSCYGYPRKTSPNIDKFAREGATFLNCSAAGPATLYASPALLTGRYLATNKIEPYWDNILGEEFTTLAEYLKKRGYYTMAFAANVQYRTGTGFEQGFDYFSISLGIDAKQLNSEILSLLAKRSREKPIFVWAHYMEPHAPYQYREDYFKLFEPDKLYKANDKLLQLKPDNLDKEKAFSIWTSHGYIPPIVFHKDRYNLNYYIACYDAEVAYVDSAIKKLFQNIKNNSIVVLTADHGESLGEHNAYFSRGGSLYDELLHIPLIIKDNRYFKAGATVKKAVSAVDIVPTILSRIDPVWYFFNKARFDGIDLRPIAQNKEVHRSHTYSYFPYAFSIRDTTTNIKYILRKAGSEELYTLPNETSNLINNSSAEIASVRERLKERLRLWLKAYPVPSDTNAKKVSLDEETKDNLRSLGYLK